MPSANSTTDLIYRGDPLYKSLIYRDGYPATWLGIGALCCPEVIIMRFFAQQMRASRPLGLDRDLRPHVYPHNRPIHVALVSI
jgi:hypothetical protein